MSLVVNATANDPSAGVCSTVDMNSSTTFDNSSEKITKSSFTMPGVRYFMVLLVFTGTFFACFTRVNINIALVAMTKSPNSTANSSIVDVKTYDWNQNTQGTILASFYWTYMIFQVPGGVLVENIGGKWLVSVALVSSSLINFLTPFLADYLYLFIGSRMFLGMIQAGLFSGSFSIVTNWIPVHQRSFSYSLIRVGAIIGTIAINVFTGYLSANFGWPYSFYIPGLMGSAFVLIFIIFMQDYPSQCKCITDAELKLIQTSNPKRAEPKLSQIPWALILTNVPVLIAGFLKFSYFWLFFLIQSKLPTYLDTIAKMDLKSNGNVNGMFHLFNCISLTFSGWLSDQVIHRGYLSRIHTRKTFTFIAIMGSGLLLALIPSISSQSLLLFLLYASAFLLGFASGGDVPLPAEMSPSMPATVFSLINMLSMISGFAAPQYAGLILESGPGSLADRWAIIFYTTFAICIVATLLFLIFASCERQNFDFVVVEALMKKEISKDTNQPKDINTSTSVSVQ